MDFYRWIASTVEDFQGFKISYGVHGVARKTKNTGIVSLLGDLASKEPGFSLAFCVDMYRFRMVIEF